MRRAFTATFVTLSRSYVATSAFRPQTATFSLHTRRPLARLFSAATMAADGPVTANLEKSRMRLKEVDSLFVTCVVDNECDTMSTGLQGIDGFSYHSEKTRHSASEEMCVAGHGLSLLLTAVSGGETSTLLLDAGPSPQLWKENADKLGLVGSSVEAVVLSHYHYDHSGGLRGAVPAIVEARRNVGRKQPLLVDLQSSRIVSRGSRNPNGSVTPHSPTNPSVEELKGMNAAVEIHDEPHTLLDENFFVSGYIPRTSFVYEKGMPPTHVTQTSDGDWQSDTEIADERYVACHVKDRGLVVFSACSHAGINNVCRDAQSKTDLPIFGIVGGLHLVGKNGEQRISSTVSDLQQQIKPSVIIGGHCTGWKGKAQLAHAFPDSFQPLAVGGSYVFRA